MEKNLLKRIAVGTALVGTLAGCVGQRPIVHNLVGKSLNPVNAEPISASMQATIDFGVPLTGDSFGNLIGLEETNKGYKVVSCVPYTNPSISRAETMAHAASAILNKQGKSAGYVEGLRPFKSRRVNDLYCVGYTALKQ